MWLGNVFRSPLPSSTVHTLMQAERELAAASAAEGGIAAWPQTAEFAAWGPSLSAAQPERQQPQVSPGEAEEQPADEAAALRRRKAELAAMLDRITRACLSCHNVDSKVHS